MSLKTDQYKICGSRVRFPPSSFHSREPNMADTPKLMTPEEIAEIRARESKATPEPWTADTVEPHDCVVWGPTDEDGIIINVGAPLARVSDMYKSNRHNTRFIASARTDIPRLLSHIEAMEVENTKLKEELAVLNKDLAEKMGLAKEARIIPDLHDPAWTEIVVRIAMRLAATR